MPDVDWHALDYHREPTANGRTLPYGPLERGDATLQWVEGGEVRSADLQPPARTPKGRIPSGRPHSLDVRLSDAERADVRALADALGTTQADAIRVAVRAELARRTNNNAPRGGVFVPPPTGPSGRFDGVEVWVSEDGNAPRGGGEG